MTKLRPTLDRLSTDVGIEGFDTFELNFEKYGISILIGH